MLIRFQCTHCLVNLKVSVESAGQSQGCPACHAALTVPPSQAEYDRGVAQTAARVRLNDPFHLDFPEIKDNRSFDWLAKKFPNFNVSKLNEILHSSTADRKLGMKIADDTATECRNLWIPFGWAAKFRLENGEVDDAIHVLSRGIVQCKQKAYLYDVVARASLDKGDLPSLLGWAVKSFVACEQIGIDPSNQTLLYIVEIAALAGHQQFREDLLARVSTRFSPQVIEQLTRLYQRCPDKRNVDAYLKGFRSVWTKKLEAEHARTQKALSAFPRNRYPRCRGCGKRMRYVGRDNTDKEIFIFRCDTCGLATGGRIEELIEKRDIVKSCVRAVSRVFLRRRLWVV